MSSSQQPFIPSRRVFLLLALGACGAPVFAGDAQTQSPNEEFLHPETIEFRALAQMDRYYGFNEFVRSGEPAMPKKYARLGWDGELEEFNSIDWIGGAKSVFSGTAIWTKDGDYTNTLQNLTYLNMSSTSPGDGSNGPYTVQGYEGGGCGELHGVVNVTKLSSGDPGLSLPIQDGPAELTQLTRKVSGAMGWHWNDLGAPCNLMDFDAGSDGFPNRGPVTETLSQEVTEPKTTKTEGQWKVRQTNDIIEASVQWAIDSESGEWKPGGQEPLVVTDGARDYRVHFPSTACGAGKEPQIILVVSAKQPSGEFIKYAIKATAQVKTEEDGTVTVEGQLHADKVVPVDGQTLADLPLANFQESKERISESRVVRLETVLLKPGEGDCTSCTNNHVHSIDWSVSLGKLSNGISAGALTLNAESFSALVFTPAALVYSAPTFANDQLRQVARADGGWRQIRTGTRLYDIIGPVEDAALPAGSYEVRTYLQSAAAPSSGEPDLWTPTGNPLERVRFSDPDGTGQRLRIERFAGGSQPFSTVEYAFTADTNTWSLTEEGLRRTDRTKVAVSATEEQVTTAVWDLASGTPQLASKVAETFHIYTVHGAKIRAVTQRTLDPDGAALVSQMTYDVDDKGELYLTSSQGYDGTLAYYARGGNATVTSTPFGNPDAYRYRSEYSFTQNDGATLTRQRGIGLTGLSELALVTTVQIGGEKFTQTRSARSRTNFVNQNDPSLVWEIQRDYGEGPFSGRNAYRLDRSGVLTLTTYSLDAGTQRLTQTVRSGAPNAAADAVIDGTQTVTVANPDGEMVSRDVTDIASGLVIDQQVVLDRDDHGRATVISQLDGSLEERSYNTCCGLLESLKRHGMVTTYSYDSLKRRVTETTAGITLRFKYDALGRVVETRRVGSDNSEIVLSASAYDAAGRVTSTTDARGGVTTYAVLYNNDGTTTRTTTAPDESTVIEVRNRDGSLQNRSGTGTTPAYFSYDQVLVQDPNLSYTVIVTTTNKAQPGVPATEWIKTSTDAFDSVVREEFPDGAAHTWRYNARNQLISESDPDNVTTLYAYNARGEREVQAVDLNRNGIIDYAGPDRIIRTQHEIVSAHGATVNRVTASAWTANGADTPEAIGINESSVDGRQSWQTAAGVTSHNETVYGSGSTRTQTATAPDGTVSVQTFAEGRLQSALTSHPSLGTLASVTYSYDPHGRLGATSQLSAFNTQLVTTYTYFNDDSVHTVTTPDPDPERTGDGYDPQATTYAYDIMGRIQQVTLPDAGVTHTTYYPTGATKRTWGTRTYPSEYSYDEQGRMKTLTTWQDFAGDTGRAVTIWNYDAKRGWLSGKLDAAGKGNRYTYSPAGRLSLLFRARESLSAPITYGYGTDGNLAGTVYPDTTTSVSLSYDRLGRLATRTDAAGTCTYAYQGVTNLMTSETYSGGLLNGLSVSRGYDTYNRNDSISSAGNAPLTAYALAYDAASRLSIVTQGSNTATYAYTPNVSLVQSVTFKQGENIRLTTTKVYDNLNRLTSISSQPSALSSQLSYTYSYNSANQRTQARREDDSRWDYGYDALGQVTSAAKTKADATPILGHSFGYTYDDIGNRKTATANALTSNYATNALNQYDSRTTPGALELLGSADPAAAITVNSAAVPRQNSLFYDQLPVDNSGAAQYQSLNVQGVNSTAGVTVDELRHAFLPKNPETFIYDADGNLTDDSRWHYVWDAENHLVEMQTSASAIAAGVPKKRLVFVYDSVGRRIAKRVMGWDATANAWGVQSSKRFLYDGWNLITELDALSSNGLIRSYVWGLDLSGSIQGAGGVGGLLFSTLNPQLLTLAAAYDGNGNVSGYVDMATGLKSATYEYNAFGETLLASGETAELLPFRFSTKYNDSETSLLYYGLRYYIPSMGRWLSRDPLEEQGGENLMAFVLSDPISGSDSNGLKTSTGRDAYWDQWKKDNPGRDASKDRKREDTLNHGCIGVTCLNLGTPNMPSTSNCYKLRAQAEARRDEMKKGCDCKGNDSNGSSAEPHIFSIHFWNDTGRDSKSPDVTFDSATGKADLSNWDIRGRPAVPKWKSDGRGGYNFDYGWLNPDGSIQHANHYHNPPGSPMEVYNSAASEWQDGAPGHYQYEDFNAEVWCVECNSNRF